MTKEIGIKQKRNYRPLVYICSPFSGDVEDNTERTKQFCRFALEQGQIPLAPQLMFPQFMDDENPEERELALFMDIVLLGKCSEMWVLATSSLQGCRPNSMWLKSANRKLGTLTANTGRWSHYE